MSIQLIVNFIRIYWNVLFCVWFRLRIKQFLICHLKTMTSMHNNIWLADNMMYLIYNYYKVHLLNLFNFDFIFNFTQIINSFFPFAFHDSIFSKVWSHIIEDRNWPDTSDRNKMNKGGDLQLVNKRSKLISMS